MSSETNIENQYVECSGEPVLWADEEIPEGSYLPIIALSLFSFVCGVFSGLFLCRF